MKKLLVITLLSLAAACGGGKKASTTPTTGTDAAKKADPKSEGKDAKDGKEVTGPMKAKTDGGGTEEDPCATP